jgi:hypothetical protein
MRRKNMNTKGQNKPPIRPPDQQWEDIDHTYQNDQLEDSNIEKDNQQTQKHIHKRTFANEYNTTPLTEGGSILTPLKISWRHIYEKTSSMHQPQIISDTQDDNKKEANQPVLVMLAKLLNQAKNNSKFGQLKIQTSKSNIVLTAAHLLDKWSINDIKNNFEFVIARDSKIQLTLWIDLKDFTLWEWKKVMIPYLKKENIWIVRHTAPMNCVHTTILGFYSGKHHPDATHFPTLQYNLNDQINRYLQENEDQVT